MSNTIIVTNWINVATNFEYVDSNIILNEFYSLLLATRPQLCIA